MSKPVKQTIPMSEWKWFGNAGHLCIARDCQFHLCTQVGGFLVSTVGQYVPGESTREALAKSRGIVLSGRGDDRYADYMNKIGYEEIGFGRKYETMVFRAGNPCTNVDCNCGMPELADASQLDTREYNSAGEATAGHIELCHKWSDAATGG
jgi:hypothetical protein